MIFATSITSLVIAYLVAFAQANNIRVADAAEVGCTRTRTVTAFKTVMVSPKGQVAPHVPKTSMHIPQELPTEVLKRTTPPKSNPVLQDLPTILQNLPPIETPTPLEPMMGCPPAVTVTVTSCPKVIKDLPTSAPPIPKIPGMPEIRTVPVTVTSSFVTCSTGIVEVVKTRTVIGGETLMGQGQGQIQGQGHEAFKTEVEYFTSVLSDDMPAQDI